MKTNYKVLKYKLAINNRHLYSCGFILLNSKTKSVERICCVVSYNPAIFEVDVKQDIDKIETIVYKSKFDEGCCSELTRKLYVSFHNLEEKISSVIENESEEAIKNLLIESLNIDDRQNIRFEYSVENLKYNIEDTSDYSRIETDANKFSSNKFFIKAKPVIENKKGVSIEKLKLKNEILCELTDNREIVKYIMRILFAKDKDEKRFYARIIEINKKNERYYEIICSLTPIILTKIIVEKTKKLVVKK
mgnify:CR=1 FL=1